MQRQNEMNMNKQTIITILLALVAILTVLPLETRAQTMADSLRADSIYKSMELQGVEVAEVACQVRHRQDHLRHRERPRFEVEHRD